MHVKYVNDAFAAAKANAKALGNEFSGTKYDYYKHPHNADGVRINDLEESVIEENYKSFSLLQSIAACRKLSISYNRGVAPMNKAEIHSALGEYFAGRNGKISCLPLLSLLSIKFNLPFS